jgi:hypothetical protein
VTTAVRLAMTATAASTTAATMTASTAATMATATAMTASAAATRVGPASSMKWIPIAAGRRQGRILRRLGAQIGQTVFLGEIIEIHAAAAFELRTVATTIGISRVGTFFIEGLGLLRLLLLGPREKCRLRIGVKLPVWLPARIRHRFLMPTLR